MLALGRIKRSFCLLAPALAANPVTVFVRLEAHHARKYGAPTIEQSSRVSSDCVRRSLHAVTVPRCLDTALGV